MRVSLRIALGLAYLSFSGFAHALPPAGSGGSDPGDGPKTCAAPLVLASGKCVPCAAGSQYSSATKTCVAIPACPAGSVGTVPNCKCPQGTFGTPGNCHTLTPPATCPPNMVGTPGNCHTCPAGKHPQNNQCVS
jgi:hypothetical protein